MVFGPALDTMSATSESGTFLPSAGLHHEVERPARLIHLRDGFSGKVHGNELVELGQRNAVAQQQFAAGDDFQLRAFYLLLHVQVGNSVDVLARLLYLVAYGEHLVEVGAEELYGNACLRAGEHGVDAVGYGLSYLYVCPCQHRETLAHVVEHLLMAAPVELERSLYLAHVHA